MKLSSVNKAKIFTVISSIVVALLTDLNALQSSVVFILWVTGVMYGKTCENERHFKESKLAAKIKKRMEAIDDGYNSS